MFVLAEHDHARTVALQIFELLVHLRRFLAASFEQEVRTQPDQSTFDTRCGAFSWHRLIVVGRSRLNSAGGGSSQNGLGEGMLGSRFDSGGELQDFQLRVAREGHDCVNFRSALGQRARFVERDRLESRRRFHEARHLSPAHRAARPLQARPQCLPA